MKSISEYIDQILAHEKLQLLIEDLSKEMLSRNLPPMLVRRMSESDTYQQIESILKSLASGVDFNEQDSLNDAQYDWVRHALFFDLDNLLNGQTPYTILAYQIERYLPDIDKYIDHINDHSIEESLGLTVDDEGMIVADNNIVIRKQALFFDSKIMLYPHSFLRRFYFSNFVNTLLLASKHRSTGSEVRIRIDPLRQPIDLNLYDEMGEHDYWYGPGFKESLLTSRETTEVKTVHSTRLDDTQQHMRYPLGSTIFRSNMMDEGERQFTVEEFAPYVNPLGSAKPRPQGTGDLFSIQKFSHFVYDQKENVFTHIDLAVRIFTVDEYKVVYEGAKRGDPGAKIGVRHKLLKITGRLGLDEVQGMLYDFFRYNPHIGEYLGADGEL